MRSLARSPLGKCTCRHLAVAAAALVLLALAGGPAWTGAAPSPGTGAAPSPGTQARHPAPAGARGRLVQAPRSSPALSSRPSLEAVSSPLGHGMASRGVSDGSEASPAAGEGQGLAAQGGGWASRALALATRRNLPSGVRLVLLFTVFSLAPAILVMVTSFTRIIIVLLFIRKALGLDDVPPTSVLMGLAVFLTLFNMSGVVDEVNRTAVVPVTEGRIGLEEGLSRGLRPLRQFMFAQTRRKDLALFVRLGRVAQLQGPDQVPTTLLVPAFVISELKTAFQIGIVLFLPFLLVDLVVSSTLLSMGLSGLSPHAVSLPFKLLLFVLVDGWGLIVTSLMQSFR